MVKKQAAIYQFNVLIHVVSVSELGTNIVLYCTLYCYQSNVGKNMPKKLESGSFFFKRLLNLCPQKVVYFLFASCIYQYSLQSWTTFYILKNIFDFFQYITIKIINYVKQVLYLIIWLWPTRQFVSYLWSNPTRPSLESLSIFYARVARLICLEVKFQIIHLSITVVNPSKLCFSSSSEIFR